MAKNGEEEANRKKTVHVIRPVYSTYSPMQFTLLSSYLQHEAQRTTCTNEYYHIGLNARSVPLYLFFSGFGRV
jgi:hypothetical protein